MERDPNKTKSPANIRVLMAAHVVREYELGVDSPNPRIYVWHHLTELLKGKLRANAGTRRTLPSIKEHRKMSR